MWDHPTVHTGDGEGLNRFLIFSDPDSIKYVQENMKITFDLNNETFTDSSITGFARGLIANITVCACLCVSVCDHLSNIPSRDAPLIEPK